MILEKCERNASYKIGEIKLIELNYETKILFIYELDKYFMVPF